MDLELSMLYYLGCFWESPRKIFRMADAIIFDALVNWRSQLTSVLNMIASAMIIELK